MGLITFGKTPRIILPDSNTQLWYKLDDTATPWVNSGQAGSLNLTEVAGTVRRAAATGLLSACVDLIGTAACLASANTSACEPAQALTMSAWVFPHAFTKTFADIVMKQYRANGTWTAPFESLGLEMDSTTNGGWAFNLCTSATTTGVGVSSAGDRLRLAQWQLVAGTYDGTTMRAYLNGNAVGTSTARSGNVDYGTHGRWCVGGNPANDASSAQRWDGLIDDVRVESVVRSQAYLQLMYKYGMGLYE